MRQNKKNKVYFKIVISFSENKSAPYNSSKKWYFLQSNFKLKKGNNNQTSNNAVQTSSKIKSSLPSLYNHYIITLPYTLKCWAHSYHYHNLEQGTLIYLGKHPEWQPIFFLPFL